MKPRLENTAASAAQIRHVVFHLETAIALMPKGVQNLCIIIDFAGSSMTKNPGVAIAREIINVLGSHYPERLGKGYIIHGTIGQHSLCLFSFFHRALLELTQLRNSTSCFHVISAMVLFPLLQTDLTLY